MYVSQLSNAFNRTRDCTAIDNYEINVSNETLYFYTTIQNISVSCRVNYIVCEPRSEWRRRQTYRCLGSGLVHRGRSHQRGPLAMKGRSRMSIQILNFLAPGAHTVYGSHLYFPQDVTGFRQDARASTTLFASSRRQPTFTVSAFARPHRKTCYMR